MRRESADSIRVLGEDLPNKTPNIRMHLSRFCKKALDRREEPYTLRLIRPTNVAHRTISSETPLHNP